MVVVVIWRILEREGELLCLSPNFGREERYGKRRNLDMRVAVVVGCGRV